MYNLLLSKQSLSHILPIKCNTPVYVNKEKNCSQMKAEMNNNKDNFSISNRQEIVLSQCWKYTTLAIKYTTHWYTVLQIELMISKGTLQAEFQQLFERVQWFCYVHMLYDEVLILRCWQMVLNHFLLDHYTAVIYTTQTTCNCVRKYTQVQTRFAY